MLAGHLGFHHQKITPLRPRANATAEHFIRTLEKAICAAEIVSIPWKHTLNTFLSEYRSTPHSATEASPAGLMFQHKIHTKIPILTSTKWQLIAKSESKTTQQKQRWRLTQTHNVMPRQAPSSLATLCFTNSPDTKHLTHPATVSHILCGQSTLLSLVECLEMTVLSSKPFILSSLPMNVFKGHFQTAFTAHLWMHLTVPSPRLLALNAQLNLFDRLWKFLHRTGTMWYLNFEFAFRRKSVYLWVMVERQPCTAESKRISYG